MGLLAPKIKESCLNQCLLCCKNKNIQSFTGGRDWGKGLEWGHRPTDTQGCAHKPVIRDMSPCVLQLFLFKICLSSSSLGGGKLCSYWGVEGGCKWCPEKALPIPQGDGGSAVTSHLKREALQRTLGKICYWPLAVHACATAECHLLRHTQWIVSTYATKQP